MSQLIIDHLDTPRGLAGQEVAATDWLGITQERIGQFAEATEDRQWIHLDRERARRESPYGTTIAHGFLTLSLLSHFLTESIKLKNGVRFAINYGLNRVRFPAAVPAGSKIRARFTLQSVKDAPGGLEATWQATVEREGSETPCCVAEWLIRYYA